MLKKLNLSQFTKVLNLRLDSFGYRLISTYKNKKLDNGILSSINHERMCSTFQPKQAICKSNQTKQIALIAGYHSNSKDERNAFMSVFPDIVRDLTLKAEEYGGEDVMKLFSKNLWYNVPGGKQNRALATFSTYKQLINPNKLTDRDLENCRILGWCLELLQAYVLMLDDIIDSSPTRRGQPCWHTLEGVGLSAINDAIMIESGIFLVLKKYFSEKYYYPKLLELFHRILLITIVGEAGDILGSKNNIDKFNMNNYKTTAMNKTGYCSYYLPVASAMNLAEIKDERAFCEAKSILLKIGVYFQIQDDFLDCFGDPKLTGKIGTDIEENKCTWLAVVAMQKANDTQKSILKECYGSYDSEKSKNVKQIYCELGMPNIYANYEEEFSFQIKEEIQKATFIPHEVYLSALRQVFKRNF